METIGAPHSSIAPIASSGVSRWRRTSVGYWILPQPGQARLQAKSGSSSTMSGNRSFFRSRCFMRYADIRRFWRRGMPTNDQSF